MVPCEEVAERGLEAGLDHCFEVCYREGEELERDGAGVEVEVGEPDGFDGVGETVWCVDGLVSVCQWWWRWRGFGYEVWEIRAKAFGGWHAYVEDLAHPSLCLAEGFEVHVAEVAPYLLDDLDWTRLERHG